MGRSVLALCALLPGITGAEIVFTDVTGSAGIDLFAPLTQSVAWGDYDDDGDPDLYLTNGGANRLYRNNGDGTLSDVTEQAGVAGPLTASSIGAAFGDLDNDGDLDLYISHINEGSDQLYRNEGPDADGVFTFTDVATSAGIVIERSARGTALTDYDRDGLVDIYALASGANMLYRNQGDWNFTDVAPALGIAPEGRDVGVVATDVNNDGWPDLFVANRTFDPTHLFINNNGQFTDQAVAAGISATGLGMGVISIDYDNDLDFDLYWTTWPGEEDPLLSNVFYRNDGDLSFTDVTVQTGTADVGGWGISANVGDIDLDGFMDFFIANGFDPGTTDSILYRNRGDGSFEDRTELLGTIPHDARGVAFADYDLDGDLDLLVTGGANEHTRLWRNDSTTDNHYLKVRLRGSSSNHFGVGARVTVTTAAGSTVQEMSGSTGRGNQNPLELVFGLGSQTTVEQVRVDWPSGMVQLIDPGPADRTLTLLEPGPQPLQFSGLWYGGPTQSGHGFNIELLADNRFVAFWYTFDNAGNRHWLIIQGTRNGTRLEGTAFTVDGGLFPPLFDVDQTEFIEWGGFVFEFSGCTAGSARWSPVVSGFSEGSMAIERLASMDGLDCGITP